MAMGIPTGSAACRDQYRHPVKDRSTPRAWIEPIHSVSSSDLTSGISSRQVVVSTGRLIQVSPSISNLTISVTFVYVDKG